MKYFLIAAGLALMGAAACQQKEADTSAAEAAAGGAVVPSEDSGFEFTVKKTGLELVFSGVKGTQWREAKHSCKAMPCEFVLDTNGVNTNMPVSGFGIAFHVGAKGVDMTSAGGAAWNTLSYACEGKECAFKVNDKGVAGI